MAVKDIKEYEIIKQYYMEDLNSQAYLLKHKKTGARIALLSNDDNNKVFNNIRIVYKKEILYGENVECYYEEQNNKHIITAKSQDNINAIIELS